MNHTPHFDRYARSLAGRHDRSAYLVARFIARDGVTDLKRRLPGPRHVALHLTAPALTGAVAPDDTEALRAFLRELLSAMPHRENDGQGNNVASHYSGLHAAFHWRPAVDSDPAAASFDREAYLDAILTETAAELLREEHRASRVAERSSPARPRTRAARAEARARYEARLDERQREYVRSWLDSQVQEMNPGDAITRAEAAELLIGVIEEAQHELEDLRDEIAAAEVRYTSDLQDYRDAVEDWEARRRFQPSLDPRTRPRRPQRPAPLREQWAELADEYGYPRALPPSIGPRRAVTLLAELAPEFGLVERRSNNTRRFVLPAIATATDAPTAAAPSASAGPITSAPVTTPDRKELLMNAADLRDIAAATREAAAATREYRAELEALYELQIAAFADGERTVALRYASERHRLAREANVVPFPTLRQVA